MPSRACLILFGLSVLLLAPERAAAGLEESFNNLVAGERAFCSRAAAADSKALADLARLVDGAYPSFVKSQQAKAERARKDYEVARDLHREALDKVRALNDEMVARIAEIRREHRSDIEWQEKLIADERQERQAVEQRLAAVAEEIAALQSSIAQQGGLGLSGAVRAKQEAQQVKALRAEQETLFAQKRASLAEELEATRERDRLRAETQAKEQAYVDSMQARMTGATGKLAALEEDVERSREAMHKELEKAAQMALFVEAAQSCVAARQQELAAQAGGGTAGGGEPYAADKLEKATWPGTFRVACSGEGMKDIGGPMSLTFQGNNVLVQLSNSSQNLVATIDPAGAVNLVMKDEMAAITVTGQVSLVPASAGKFRPVGGGTATAMISGKVFDEIGSALIPGGTVTKASPDINCNGTWTLPAT